MDAVQDRRCKLTRHPEGSAVTPAADASACSIGPRCTFELRATEAGGRRMVEVADPGQPSEAGRLAQKSTEQFRAGQIDKAQEYAGDSALAAAYTLLQQIVGVMAFLLPPVLFFGNWALTGNELESSISAYYH